MAGAPCAWATGRSVIAFDFHRRLPEARPTLEVSSPTLVEPLRILIIDEDDDDFLLLQTLLARAEDATFLVDRAASSDNGLARLLEGGYDACLCDSSGGPQRDGLELIRMAQRRGCRTPIILTAGYADLGLQHEALEAGATDLIEKEEVDTERLDRAIRFAVARERRVARLTRLAQRDELTGLANGQLFADRLEQGLAAARRHRTLLAIMILDVDGFKTISDTVGHLAGDLLLLTVGERLRSRVWATDTVARLGSDEFAILIEDLARPDYSAPVARKLLDAMAAPVVVGDREVTLSVSIGAAIYPRDGMDAATLLHHADAAMYRAKAEGGHLCCFHDELLDTRAQRGAVAAAELRRAIEQDELALHFQPQVTLCAPELGLASLVCWRHPDLGLIDPERIRQLAEDAGLLEPLTHWLIMAACRQARRWGVMRGCAGCTSPCRCSPGVSSPGASSPPACGKAGSRRACPQAGWSARSTSASCWRSLRPAAQRCLRCASSGCGWRSMGSAAARPRSPSSAMPRSPPSSSPGPCSRARPRTAAAPSSPGP